MGLYRVFDIVFEPDSEPVSFDRDSLQDGSPVGTLDVLITR